MNGRKASIIDPVLFSRKERPLQSANFRGVNRDAAMVVPSGRTHGPMLGQLWYSKASASEKIPLAVERYEPRPGRDVGNAVIADEISLDHAAVHRGR